MAASGQGKGFANSAGSGEFLTSARLVYEIPVTMAAITEICHGSNRARHHGRLRPIRRLDAAARMAERRDLFDVNERPILYTLCFAVHVGMVVMCAAFAAGYWPHPVGEFVI